MVVIPHLLNPDTSRGDVTTMPPPTAVAADGTDGNTAFPDL
jgi:hypothetical protein